MQLRRIFVAMFIGLLVATAAEAESFRLTLYEAKSGDAEAQGRLGLIYRDGIGVPQDFVQAHAWFSVASANGNGAAATERNELAKQMRSIQIARAQLLVVDYPQTYRVNVTPAVSDQSARRGSNTQNESRTAQPDYARPGLYVGMGFAGAVFTEAEEADEKFLLAFLGYAVDVSYDTAVGLDLVGGYRFHPRFAAQLHLQYLPDTTVSVEGIDFIEFDTLTFTADLKGYLLTGRIQPYGLVGLGLMYVDTSGFDSTEFAARLGGGVDYYFTENFVLAAEIGGVLPTETLKEFDQFTFAFGMQYRF